ncbi:MAG: phosphatidate cytidylyltransferase [Bacteroidales bacterium]|jgi:phosphatidate cytidylyltransferase|nr:phosphatidate cytidylyltransferase [Bacteroidales bacterium]
MKKLIIRTITGIAYLSILAAAFSLSKFVLISVFTIFLILALYEYIILSQKFPAPKNRLQNLTQKYLLPTVWIFIPVLLLEYWCIILNATKITAALFVILCLNDTLAYLFGSLLGKHKMWRKVSPKKSWEGFFCGLIITIAASWVIIKIPYLNDIFTNPYLWIGFAFVVIVAGTFGDFAESMVKRYAQEKDSGTILPGHGGILDRIDSMLFAVPAGFIYWAVVGL